MRHKSSKLPNISIGDKYMYQSCHIGVDSFYFEIFGIGETNVDIIINKDVSPKLYKLKINELKSNHIRRCYD